jgi:PBP1b-binding outer membrane lipoprotein LpoB
VDNSILKAYENVGYIPSIGFVAIIDSQKGDYKNLAIAYLLARDIALNAKLPDLDLNILSAIIKRIIKNIGEFTSVRNLVESNIQNNKEILKQLEKSMLLMEFNQQYLSKFLQEGTLTKKDLLEYYMGEEIKDKFKLIEREINELE